MSKKVKGRLKIKFKPWMGVFGLGVFLEVFFKVKKTRTRLKGGEMLLEFLYKPEKKV